MASTVCAPPEVPAATGWEPAVANVALVASATSNNSGSNGHRSDDRGGGGAAAGATNPATATAAAATDDMRHMCRALELARRAAAAGEVPVGAVVVDAAGVVVAEAHNSTEASGHPLAHAELLAIQAAAAALGGWRLAGCTLFVTLEPCPMCAGAALNARLRRVVYGARSPRVGADGGWVSMLGPRPLRPVAPAAARRAAAAAGDAGAPGGRWRDTTGRRRAGPVRTRWQAWTRREQWRQRLEAQQRQAQLGPQQQQQQQQQQAAQPQRRAGGDGIDDEPRHPAHPAATPRGPLASTGRRCRRCGLGGGGGGGGGAGVERAAGGCGSGAVRPARPHPFHPGLQVVRGLMADESSALLRAFFQRRRLDAALQRAEARRALEAGGGRAPGGL